MLGEKENNIHCFMTGDNCVSLTREKYEEANKRNKVFVLMPFRQPYFDYYKFAIKEYFSSRGWNCTYGGESTFSKGEYVICKICDEIYNSSLIVADLSSKNPNVYYEFGIAHGLGKKTIAMINRNILNNESENILSFLSGKCHKIYYKSIGDLYNDFITDAKKFPIPNFIKYSYFTQSNALQYEKNAPIVQEERNEKEEYSLICLIPSENKNEKKIMSYEEIYEYGIKMAIQRLEFPGDDLIGLKRDNVYNIIYEAYSNYSGRSIEDLIKYIANARYCIIDITDTNHQEVFYWLGFIHGLRINPNIKLRDDITCLYITRGDMRELPFDIRAARVINYSDIEELNSKVQSEIENLEISKIREANKEKERFWKKFNIKNTKFLVGASDSYPPAEKEPRNRISIQDFQSYNRIIYQLLFLGPRKSFQYSMEILDIDKYIKNYKESLDFLFENKDRTIKNEEIINYKYNKDCIKKFSFFDINKDGIKNFIIIGSSCVNPAAENLMLTLYPLEKEKSSGDYFEFRTSHPYKGRSYYWTLIDKESEERKKSNECYITERSGIFYNGQRVGKRKRIDKDLIKDTALLIIYSKKCYLTLCQSHDKRCNTEGDIILISGFGKNGTYSLSRIISKINIDDDKNGEYLLVDNDDKNKFSKDKYKIDDFFKLVNLFKKKNESYYIEAVFDFHYQNKEENKHDRDCKTIIKHFKCISIDEDRKKNSTYPFATESSVNEKYDNSYDYSS